MRDVHFLDAPTAPRSACSQPEIRTGIVFSPTGDRLAALGRARLDDLRRRKGTHRSRRSTIETEQVADRAARRRRVDRRQRRHGPPLPRTARSSRRCPRQRDAGRRRSSSPATRSSRSASDSTLVDRATPTQQQLVIDAAACAHPSFAAERRSRSTTPAPASQLHVYVGAPADRRSAGRSSSWLRRRSTTASGAHRADRGSRRVRFDAGGKLIAHLADESSAAAVRRSSTPITSPCSSATTARAVALDVPRRTSWEQLADLPGASGAIAIARGGWFVGTSTATSSSCAIGDGEVVHTADLADRAELPRSPRRSAAGSRAQLGDGAHRDPRRHDAARSRASSSPPTRSAAPRCSTPPATSSSGRAAARLTIWDRATGDELVFNLDLMKRDDATARFTPDGRIEVDGYARRSCSTSRAIPGPPPQILREIDCRVPLRVDGRPAGARSTPTCASELLQSSDLPTLRRDRRRRAPRPSRSIARRRLAIACCS